MANIKKSILIRVRVSFLIALFFAIAIIGKVIHIQFIEGESWATINKKITLYYKKIKATRGNIYSDNGSLLATSLPFYEVAFDPSLPSDEIYGQGIDSLAYLLSMYYGGRNTESYRRMIQDARLAKRRYIVLNRRQINYQTKKMMTSWPIFRQGRYRGGVIFEKKNVRYRPFSDLSKRTIGFVNENGKGAGLEYSFDDLLGGKDGEELFQKISGGVSRPVFEAENVKPEDGFNIHTTIDVNLQDVVETSLLRAAKKHRADEAVAVVMEVKTGHVKAISNLTREGENMYYEKFNHAVGGLYEPGSTFKLVTMMALLEEFDIDLSDTIDTGNGVYSIYGNSVRDHHKQGLGKISIEEAFEKSSNIAMAKLTNHFFGKDPASFIDYVDKLHLSVPLGLQIVGEGRPKITRPEEKNWSGITLPWMSYGYGFELTPLHTLALYNAIANEGRLLKPLFVTAISQADHIEQVYPVEVLSDRICSFKTLNQLRFLLEGVVDRGTASNLRGSDYKIAGKTGTVVILEGGIYAKKYNTSFVGYFPAHHPKYSAMVLIKNPKGSQQYGNNVAGPVFKEIADNIYARDVSMHQPMQKKEVLQAGVFPLIRAGNQKEISMLCNVLGVSNHSETEAAWVRAKRNGNAVLWKKNITGQSIVSDVRGMTLRDAIFLLEQQGMEVIHEGRGRVKKQSLVPGIKVSKGRRIRLILQ